MQLDVLNRLSDTDAERELLTCCGSREWARRVAAQRPYRSVDALLAASARIWGALDPPHWIQAFSAHPEIGEDRPDGRRPVSARAATWSSAEQAAMRDADADVRRRLAEGNR